jgi:hypothetical protein
MRLKYNILWIEDRADLVEDILGPKIETFLGELGFDTVIDLQLNGEKLDVLLRDNKYDLILTDLNLGEGFKTGEKLIEHIRVGNILTEVLLYSENEDALSRIIEGDKKNEEEVPKRKLIERISFALGLKYLQEKVKEIILLTIRKVQDVNNLRGLVIAETIDLENVILEILKFFFEEMDDPSLSEVKKNLAERISKGKFNGIVENLSRFWNLSVGKNALEHPSIIELIESDIFTFQNAANAINSLLNKKLGMIKNQLTQTIDLELKSNLEREIDVTGQLKDGFKDFGEEIIDLRNTLAHAKEETNDEGIPELKSRKRNGNTITFTDEKYAEIRKDLRRHANNLNKIQKNLAEFYNGNF